ncbi:MAG TPA: right-handed parallel beta-helix repeat-containing protein [Candidatus Binataceae bacterium]
MTAATAAAVLALVVGSAQPAAAAPACVSPITSCGCTIKTTGVYEVGANLTAAQGLTGRGDCIDITAPNVTLDGEGFDVTGSSTGMDGIRILVGAGKAVVSNFLEVLNWTTAGIEDDANNAQILSIDLVEKNGTGILLNTVNNSLVSDVDSNSNTGAGIVVMSGSGDTLSGFDTESNGADGMLLKNTAKPTVKDFDSDGNKGNGVDVVNNIVGGVPAISDFDASGNGLDGIFLSGTTKASVANGDADANKGSGIELGLLDNACTITSNETITNGVDGILVDFRSTKNTINNNDADDGNKHLDLEDGNPKCDTNTWTGNSFLTRSPSSCIN